ncbi:hypothetical protein J7L18_04775 [Candidatus Bathyarchaeota archaeon]|nr:hypothetical protein [Candidatus Bathyarchaeota archaeon]
MNSHSPSEGMKLCNEKGINGFEASLMKRRDGMSGKKKFAFLILSLLIATAALSYYNFIFTLSKGELLMGSMEIQCR